MVDTMSNTRAERSAALERWADRVSSDDLVVAGTEALRVIAELAVRRGELDAALIDAVRSARQADRSWSEIGAMLGVSKQAAQRKYAKAVSH
jgi:predicted ATP-dependent protease